QRRSSHNFSTALARYDADIDARVAAARRRGSVLRYVGVLEQGRAHTALKEVRVAHRLRPAKGSDTVIAFTTRRYRKTPLVVQGPGAGADVTDMGVFSAILKLLHYLPH